MNKLYILIFLSFTLYCCTNKSAEDKSTDKNILSINDLLQETSVDTVFYYTNSDKFIGRIHKARYHNNNIYLIDGIANNVKGFTAEGEFIEYVGRSGRGPGEYLKPVSITIFEDNMVLLDQNLNRITLYKYDDYSGVFVYQKSVIHNLNMTDLCETNGTIWVYGYKDGNIIHKLSKDLEQIVLSGGDLTNYDEDVVRLIISEGHIACSEKYIYSGTIYDNQIHVYNTIDGSLNNKINFDKLFPIVISRVVFDGREAFSHQGFVGTGYNDKGNYHDTLRNLTKVNNKIVAQFVRTFQNYSPSNPFIKSYIIEPENHSFKLFYDYPYIYDFRNDSYLTVINNDSLSYIMNRVN